MGVLIKSERVLDVSVFEVYGQKTIYPENETARRFARLLRQKTLTAEDLSLIGELGFYVNAIPRKEKK